MNKVLIYPFSDEVVDIMNSLSLSEEIQIVALVGDCGSKYIGKIYDLRGKRIEVSDDFDGSLEKVSLVWFHKLLETEKEYFNKKLINNLEKAVQAGKKIWYCREPVTAMEEKYVKQQKLKKGVYHKLYPAYRKKDFSNFIESIDSPVIMILGILENVGKFYLQTQIQNFAKKEEIKISGIGSRNYNDVLGLYSFPQFMYTTKEEKKKVVKYNHLVKDIEQKEQPEVMVITVPGGVLSFSHNLYGDFGITAYEIVQAVQPDCVVLCIPYSPAGEEEIENMIWSISGRLGVAIDFVAMDSKMISQDETERRREVRYITVDAEEVNEKIETLQRKIYYNLREDRGNLVKEIFRLLKGFSRIELV